MQNRTLNIRPSIGSSSRACPVCNHLGGEVIYNFGEYDAVKCAGCRVMHLTPIPSLNQLEQIYDSNYYSGEDSDKGYTDYAQHFSHFDKTYSRRLRLLNGYLDGTGGHNLSRVHEIGCALGHGIPAIEKAYHAEISVSDISDEALRYVDGKNVFALKSDGFGRCDLAPKSVDLMIAFDVIEHIPAFKKFRNWLGEVVKPGGFFLITTPDFSSIYNKLLGKRSPSFIIPEHLIYFTTETLCAAMEPQFEFKKSWSDFQVLPIELLLNKLGGVIGLSAIKTKEWAWLKKPIWSPNGMQLYLFARRN
jgi:SAM-dependent methyltransferase